MRRVRIAFFVLAVSTMIAGNAWAHAFLASAVPAVGSTVITGPKELRLQFSEAVEVRFSSVKITMEGGKDIISVKISADPSDPQKIVATPASPLAPGVYHVYWRVISVDTHKTQGDYRFTVKH